MSKRIFKIFFVALLIMQSTAFAFSIHPVSLTPLFKARPQTPKKTPAVSLPAAPKPAGRADAASKRYDLLMERLVAERERYNAIRISS